MGFLEKSSKSKTKKSVKTNKNKQKYVLGYSRHSFFDLHDWQLLGFIHRESAKQDFERGKELKKHRTVTHSALSKIRTVVIKIFKSIS